MLNRVVIVGRLTKDPELRYSQAGKPITSFTLAVDRTFKDANGERGCDFIPVVVFGPAAEHSANYLSKGKIAGVDGRIQVRTYDGQDGQKRWVTEVVAENVRFLSPRDSGGSSLGDEVRYSDDQLPF